MFDRIEKSIDQMFPIKRKSVILSEEISARYEKALADFITFEQAIKHSTGKDKDRYCELSSKYKQSFFSVQQFVIDKWAPDEYKKLINPCTPLYSMELRKMTFILAESETVEMKRSLVATLLTSGAKAFMERLGKDNVNGK